jgi:hypothetical protein
MDNPHPVGVVDSFEGLAEQRDRISQGIAPDLRIRLSESRRERTHHHEEVLALTQEAKERGNVGMIQLCQCHCLRPKSLDYLWLACELRAKHLYGDLAFKHQVDAFEHGSHPAFANLFDYLIAPNNIAYH